MAKLVKTSTPGIYRRGGRYVVVWRHRGKQHKSFHRTYEEAREAKGRRQAGDRRPCIAGVLRGVCPSLACELSRSNFPRPFEKDAGHLPPRFGAMGDSALSRLSAR
jgi:hypothetical protein